MSPRCVSNVAGCTDLRKNMPPKFSRGYHSNDKIFSLGRTSAAPRPRRPLATSALALLAPLPIPSNALFCNFYILFHTRCSIFRDFQHTPPVLGPEFLGKKRVSRTGGFSRLPIRGLGDPPVGKVDRKITKLANVFPSSRPLKVRMGSLENPPVLWCQETRRIIEATTPALPPCNGCFRGPR